MSSMSDNYFMKKYFWYCCLKKILLSREYILMFEYTAHVSCLVQHQLFIFHCKIGFDEITITHCLKKACASSRHTNTFCSVNLTQFRWAVHNLAVYSQRLGLRLITPWLVCNTGQKFGISTIFKKYFWKKSLAPQGCIYVVKNTIFFNSIPKAQTVAMPRLCVLIPRECIYSDTLKASFFEKIVCQM